MDIGISRKKFQLNSFGILFNDKCYEAFESIEYKEFLIYEYIESKILRIYFKQIIN